MTLTFSLNQPIELLSTRDLWECVKVIGAHKLEMRRVRGVDRCLDQLRLCNKRIDSLLMEEERRKRRSPLPTA